VLLGRHVASDELGGDPVGAEARLSLLYPTASERGEGVLAMLFWVLAALAVVGAVAIVWGL
jgi:hypothetical protein